jgi:hypothetical protein
MRVFIEPKPKGDKTFVGKIKIIPECESDERLLESMFNADELFVDNTDVEMNQFEHTSLVVVARNNKVDKK